MMLYRVTQPTHTSSSESKSHTQSRQATGTLTKALPNITYGTFGIANRILYFCHEQSLHATFPFSF